MSFNLFPFWLFQVRSEHQKSQFAENIAEIVSAISHEIYDGLFASCSCNFYLTMTFICQSFASSRQEMQYL